MWRGLGRGFITWFYHCYCCLLCFLHKNKYIVLQYPMIWWVSIIETKCRVARRTKKMRKLVKRFWSYTILYVIIYNLFSTIHERFLFQMRYCNTCCSFLSKRVIPWFCIAPLYCALSLSLQHPAVYLTTLEASFAVLVSWNGEKRFWMLWKRSGLLVGVKLAPVLSRKDVSEADIGPFANDCAKTSMVTPLF